MTPVTLLPIFRAAPVRHGDFFLGFFFNMHCPFSLEYFFRKILLFFLGKEYFLKRKYNQTSSAKGKEVLFPWKWHESFPDFTLYPLPLKLQGAWAHQWVKTRENTEIISLIAVKDLFEQLHSHGKGVAQCLLRFGIKALKVCTSLGHFKLPGKILELWVQILESYNAKTIQLAQEFPKLFFNWIFW